MFCDILKIEIDFCISSKCDYQKQCQENQKETNVIEKSSKLRWLNMKKKDFVNVKSSPPFKNKTLHKLSRMKKIHPKKKKKKI